jgi:hypothetical protein
MLEKESKWIANRGVLLNEAKNIQAVETDNQLEVSGAVQTRIQKHVKALEKHRKTLTEPLDSLKKQIMTQEKELRDALETEATRLKTMNDSYATKKYEDQEAARRKAEQEAAQITLTAQQEAEAIFGAGVQFDATFIPPVPEVVKPTTMANRTVIRWSFEVINPALVPDEFKTVDESKIRKYRDYVLSTNSNATPEIAGVTFTKTVSVESR